MKQVHLGEYQRMPQNRSKLSAREFGTVLNSRFSFPDSLRSMRLTSLRSSPLKKLYNQNGYSKDMLHSQAEGQIKKLLT